MSALPAQSESDIDSTPLRAAWQSDHLGERSRALDILDECLGEERTDRP